MGTWNPDQRNCNVDAELATFLTRAAEDVSGRVRGDACDAVPCAPGWVEREVMATAFAPADGACSAAAPLGDAPSARPACEVALSTRLRWQRMALEAAQGVTRFAHCQCELERSTPEERLDCRVNPDGSNRCLTGVSEAFPDPALTTFERVESTWNLMTTTPRLNDRERELPTSSQRLAQAREGLSFDGPYVPGGGASPAVSWRWELDRVHYGVCSVREALLTPAACPARFDLPLDRFEQLTDRGPGATRTIVESMDGITWAWTPRHAGRDLEGVPLNDPVDPTLSAADRASDYFRHDLAPEHVFLRRLDPRLFTAFRLDYDPCWVFGDPATCGGPLDRVDDYGLPPWLLVRDGEPPVDYQNGTFLGAALPHAVTELMSGAGRAVDVVQPSEPLAARLALGSPTVAVAVHRVDGTFAGEIAQAAGGLVLASSASALPCGAGRVQVVCGDGGPGATPTFRCAVPCDGIVGDVEGAGPGDASCLLVDDGFFDFPMTDEEVCVTAEPAVSCGRGTLACVAPVGCVVPCDGTTACDDGIIDDEGPSTCGELGLTARAVSAVRRELYVASNDDGAGVVLRTVELGTRTLRDVALSAVPADASPLALAYRLEDDALYLLDEVLGPRRHRFHARHDHGERALRLHRVSRDGSAELLGSVRPRRRGADYFLTATHDGRLMLSVSGGAPHAAFVVLDPATAGAVGVEAYVEPRRGELAGAPVTSNGNGYSLALLIAGAGRSGPELVLTELPRARFHRLGRPVPFGHLGGRL